MSTDRILHVCIGEAALEVGILWLSSQGGRSFSAFQYSDKWLRNPRAFSIAPALPLSDSKRFFHGDPQDPHSSSLPPPLADTLPDLWGRRLLRKAGQTTHDLDGFALLVAVDDFSRIGALRLLDPNTQAFLAPVQTGHLRIPPVVEIHNLVQDIHRIESDHPDRESLQRLLGGGSSLGGARPKCTVRRENGQLAIAKFTSRFDTHPVEKAEVLAIRLARLCGLATPDVQLLESQGFPVALIDRFDRHGQSRVPYLSAQSFLGLPSAVAGTYIEYADHLRQYSGNVAMDLRELFARVSFSILITNTDDHLKNHALLHDGERGWRLSPIFDVNPAPERERRLKTAIADPEEPSASIDLLIDHAEFFDLAKDDAVSLIVHQAERIGRNWRRIASECRMTRSEIRDYEPAFVHGEASRAAQLDVAQIPGDHGRASSGQAHGLSHSSSAARRRKKP